VEDLLIMKAIARRPKDLQDIRGLLAAHPDADIGASVGGRVRNSGEHARHTGGA
jgi:hypothetical protein